MIKNDKSNQLFVEIVEKLAELEHEQWIYYSKSVAKAIKNTKSIDEIKNSMIAKWENDWINYSELSDKEKEKDREWAYKVINLINSEIILFKKYYGCDTKNNQGSTIKNK